MADWRANEGRWAERRSQYLRDTTTLDKTNGEIVAYSELGYSSNGIAKQVGLAENTVKNRMNDIEGRYGKEALFALKPSEIEMVSEPGMSDADRGGD